MKINVFSATPYPFVKLVIIMCHIYIYMEGYNKGERKYFFNNIFNTFYLWVYGVGPLGKKRNPLPPLHGLLFMISSKGSFIGTILQTLVYMLSYLRWCI